MGFVETIQLERAAIKLVAERVRAIDCSKEVAVAGGHKDHGEMQANVTLAYRHLEDSAMRLGKAIQAFDGGKSVYD
jgi:hypothetical protein